MDNLHARPLAQQLQTPSLSTASGTSSMSSSSHDGARASPPLTDHDGTPVARQPIALESGAGITPTDKLRALLRQMEMAAREAKPDQHSTQRQPAPSSFQSSIPSSTPHRIPSLTPQHEDEASEPSSPPTPPHRLTNLYSRRPARETPARLPASVEPESPPRRLASLPRAAPRPESPPRRLPSRAIALRAAAAAAEANALLAQAQPLTLPREVREQSAPTPLQNFIAAAAPPTPFSDPSSFTPRRPLAASASEATLRARPRIPSATKASPPAPPSAVVPRPTTPADSPPPRQSTSPISPPRTRSRPPASPSPQQRSHVQSSPSPSPQSRKRKVKDSSYSHYSRSRDYSEERDELAAREERKAREALVSEEEEEEAEPPRRRSVGGQRRIASPPSSSFSFAAGLNASGARERQVDVDLDVSAELPRDDETAESTSESSVPIDLNRGPQARLIVAEELSMSRSRDSLSASADTPSGSRTFATATEGQTGQTVRDRRSFETSQRRNSFDTSQRRNSADLSLPALPDPEGSSDDEEETSAVRRRRNMFRPSNSPSPDTTAAGTPQPASRSRTRFSSASIYSEARSELRAESSYAESRAASSRYASAREPRRTSLRDSAESLRDAMQTSARESKQASLRESTESLREARQASLRSSDESLRETRHGSQRPSNESPQESRQESLQKSRQANATRERTPSPSPTSKRSMSVRRSPDVSRDSRRLQPSRQESSLLAPLDYSNSNATRQNSSTDFRPEPSRQESSLFGSLRNETSLGFGQRPTLAELSTLGASAFPETDESEGEQGNEHEHEQAQESHSRTPRRRDDSHRTLNGPSSPSRTFNQHSPGRNQHSPSQTFNQRDSPSRVNQSPGRVRREGDTFDLDIGDDDFDDLGALPQSSPPRSPSQSRSLFTSVGKPLRSWAEESAEDAFADEPEEGPFPPGSVREHFTPSGDQYEDAEAEADDPISPVSPVSPVGTGWNDGPDTTSDSWRELEAAAALNPPTPSPQRRARGAHSPHASPGRPSPRSPASPGQPSPARADSDTLPDTPPGVRSGGFSVARTLLREARETPLSPTPAPAPTPLRSALKRNRFESRFSSFPASPSVRWSPDVLDNSQGPEDREPEPEPQPPQVQVEQAEEPRTPVRGTHQRQDSQGGSTSPRTEPPDEAFMTPVRTPAALPNGLPLRTPHPPGAWFSPARDGDVPPISGLPPSTPLPDPPSGQPNTHPHPHPHPRTPANQAVPQTPGMPTPRPPGAWASTPVPVPATPAAAAPATPVGAGAGLGGGAGMGAPTPGMPTPRPPGAWYTPSRHGVAAAHVPARMSRLRNEVRLDESGSSTGSDMSVGRIRLSPKRRRQPTNGSAVRTALAAAGASQAESEGAASGSDEFGSISLGTVTETLPAEATAEAAEADESPEVQPQRHLEMEGTGGWEMEPSTPPRPQARVREEPTTPQRDADTSWTARIRRAIAPASPATPRTAERKRIAEAEGALEDASRASAKARSRVLAAQDAWRAAIEAVPPEAERRRTSWTIVVAWAFLEFVLLWGVFRVTIEYATSPAFMGRYDPFGPLAPYAVNVGLPAALEAFGTRPKANTNFFDLLDALGIGLGPSPPIQWRPPT